MGVRMSKVARYSAVDAKAVEAAETAIRDLLEDLERETGKQVVFATIDAGNLYCEITLLSDSTK